MPTYGYECTTCDNQFEVFQSIKDDPLKVCEGCGGTLRKRVYPVGIAFKGSGFYVNDYASKPTSSGESSGDSGSKPETKPENKTETKTEAAKPEPVKTESKAPAASAAT